jgi:hypothetical protein
MVVEDQIRAKGLGVVLDGSICEEEASEAALHPAHWIASRTLEVRYLQARLGFSRDLLWFSFALNAILFFWIVGRRGAAEA